MGQLAQGAEVLLEAVELRGRRLMDGAGGGRAGGGHGRGGGGAAAGDADDGPAGALLQVPHVGADDQQEVTQQQLHYLGRTAG